MNDEDELIDLVLKRVEFHFARHSEILENDTARLQSCIGQIAEMRQTNKAMSETLDRLEAVHKNS